MRGSDTLHFGLCNARMYSKLQVEDPSARTLDYLVISTRSKTGKGTKLQQEGSERMRG